MINMTTSVGGIQYVVRVSDDGHFLADHEEEQYRSDTLSGLRANLAKAMEADRRKNPVPFVDATTGRRGAIRGKHATRRVLLVTWDDGEKDDITTYTRLFPADVDQEIIDEIVTLTGEIQERHERLAELRRDAVQADDLMERRA
jgi:hypothetical protein